MGKIKPGDILNHIRGIKLRLDDLERIIVDMSDIKGWKRYESPRENLEGYASQEGWTQEERENYLLRGHPHGIFDRT